MLYAHALHFFCIFTMFHAFRCVFYVGTLCVGRFGLGWALDEIFVTCHMIMHYSCIRSFHFLFVTFCWLVLFCLSSFLFLSFLDILCMAPKHKTTTSRNPFHFKASSFDSTPFHVRFRDEKARQDFSENFSKRGIHSERYVILLDFSDTTLLIVINKRVGNLFVRYPWVFPLWSYRSFTPICMVLIILYLLSLFLFMVLI